MDIFLRAKHWQLFLLTFGIPFVFQMVSMMMFISSIIRNHNPAMLFNEFEFFPLIMVLFAGTLLGWQWAVATGLQKMLPAGVTMKVPKFKIFFIIPIVYLSVVMLFMAFVFSHNFTNTDFALSFSFSFLLIFPLHLFCMFCLLYCIYFVAKTFKTVELQRPVSFSDFAGEFFLVWFFPIGVWILQPKINRMIKQYTEGTVQAL